MLPSFYNIALYTAVWPAEKAMKVKSKNKFLQLFFKQKLSPFLPLSSKPNLWGHAKGVLLKTFFLNSTETFIVHCQLDRALQLCLHHNINLSHRRQAAVTATIFQTSPAQLRTACPAQASLDQPTWVKPQIPTRSRHNENCIILIKSSYLLTRLTLALTAFCKTTQW